MQKTYDVIVVGLGAVGSAAAYHLARQGWHVLGLDRFAPPHGQGSSHGGSRIIRRAYFEGTQYLPLIERAYTLWRDLEAATGETLLHVTGGLNIGPPESDVVAGARRAAEAHGLEHEVLSAGAVRHRFPAFRLPQAYAAVWEAGVGVLDPERCIAAHLAEARRYGATLCMEEPALGWQIKGEGVAVTTPRATYLAARLVLAAGGWLHELMPALRLTIERQVTGWFVPRARREEFQSGRFPIFIASDGREVVYGLPDLGRGVKVGLHHAGALVDHPAALDREVHPADVAAIRAALRWLLPGADAPAARASVCFYTNTSDRNYRIGHHPDHRAVVFASACSGHGFKASNAVGEALADLAMNNDPAVDLAPFCLRA